MEVCLLLPTHRHVGCLVKCGIKIKIVLIEIDLGFCLTWNLVEPALQNLWQKEKKKTTILM